MMNFKEAQQLLHTEIESLRFGESPQELYEPMRYLMQLGGKRLRPMLVLIGAYLFDERWQTYLKPSLTVEVFHNFTLMHDDIMDNAPLRRGKATVHEKWNNNIALLSGDVMLVKVYEMLLESVPAPQLPRVLQAFNQCAREVCEGQQYDMRFETENLVSEHEYMNMIRLKTSVLLGFSLQLGAMLANASKADEQYLYDFGVAMGLGFQLKDDYLDVFGGEAFGKQIGGDILANKKTFMLIKALAHAQGSDLETLQYWLNATSYDKQEKIKAVTALYQKLEIDTLIHQKIGTCFETAWQCLARINVDESRKNILKQFAEDLMQREIYINKTKIR